MKIIMQADSQGFSTVSNPYHAHRCGNLIGISICSLADWLSRVQQCKERLRERDGLAYFTHRVSWKTTNLYFLSITSKGKLVKLDILVGLVFLWCWQVLIGRLTVSSS